MVDEQEIDWGELIADLLFHRLSLNQISARCKVSKDMPFHLHNGLRRQPLHANGERLIKLWIEKTGKTREDLPTRSASARLGL